MKENFVSIILPTYNRENVIKKAIQSVLNQTYINWELIIVDDASNDNTEKIVKQIEDKRISYIKNEINKGANYARNKGGKIAKGNYLAFIDSDNYWVPDKLEKQIKILEKTEDDVAFVFSWEELIDEEHIIVVPDSEFDISNLETVMRKKNVVDTNVVLMKKAIFEKVGGFDVAMPRLQDYDLFFRIIVVNGYKAKFIEEVLDCNVLQKNSISKSASKYQEAAMMFLEKYHEYLDKNEIVTHLLFLLDSFEHIDALNKCINRLQEVLYAPDICGELMKKYYSQARYYETLFKWKECAEKQEKRTIFRKDFFEKYNVVAIYGLGRWGEAIYQEMKNVGIKVLYGIDKRVEKFHDIDVVRPEQIPDDIDVIIVSVFQEYEEIYSELTKNFRGKIISIESLIKGKGF